MAKYRASKIEVNITKEARTFFLSVSFLMYT